jgi:hypothetical protein
MSRTAFGRAVSSILKKSGQMFEKPMFFHSSKLAR